MAEGSDRQVRAVLHRACRLAKKWSGGALPNPTADTELPSWSLDDKTHVQAPSAEEVRQILRAAESEDRRIAVALRRHRGNRDAPRRSLRASVVSH